MIQLEWVLVVSAILFALGLYGVLARRNAVMVLLAIELMLNAVNINMIAFAAYLHPTAMVGLVFAVFIITVAAAEVALALAVILRLYRTKGSVNLDDVNLMKW